MARGYWTCQRKSDGIACRRVNPNRFRKCQACQKPRPARRRPAHMAALKESYEAFLALNGGIEACALCGAGPKTRKLQRDHCHVTGRGRGLLCGRCNRALPRWISPSWLRAAADYVERTLET